MRIVKKETLRQRRVFSEAVKRQIVNDIESGKASASSASKEFSVSVQTIYRWIYKYSRYLKKNKVLIVEDKSESYKSKELLARIKELEAALGRKQLQVEFLEKMIDFANAEYKTDIKKNLSTKLSSGSENIEETGK